MYETEWRQLIEYLDTTFTSAAARGPAEIVVVLEDDSGHARAVSILMTPLQWDHYASIPWGEFPAAARAVAKAVAATPPETPYLVYGNYELHPSTEPALASTSAPAEGPSGGHWVAENGDGTVARFDDPE